MTLRHQNRLGVALLAFRHSHSCGSDVSRPWRFLEKDPRLSLASSWVSIKVSFQAELDMLPFSIGNESSPGRNKMTTHDPHLELTVKSTSGSFADRWNRNNQAEKVYRDALVRLRLPDGRYLLKRERDGVILDLAHKLADLGLVDGDVLLLQAAQPQDG